MLSVILQRYMFQAPPCTDAYRSFVVSLPSLVVDVLTLSPGCDNENALVGLKAGLGLFHPTKQRICRLITCTPS